MLVWSAALTPVIRREILTVLAGSAAMTMPTATAQVALRRSDRRRRHGESPASVRAAEALTFQVGADLAEEFAALRAAAHRTGSSSGRGPAK